MSAGLPGLQLATIVTQFSMEFSTSQPGKSNQEKNLTVSSYFFDDYALLLKPVIVR
jgi:hypothetical protein